MLVTEQTSNGRTIVKIRKDWHPNRVGIAYTPPLQRIVPSATAYQLQTALLNKTNI
jgi:hypothetical protein